MREMLVLLGVAFIGLVSVVQTRGAQLASLAALCVLVATIVTVRMRARLAQGLWQPRAQRPSMRLPESRPVVPVQRDPGQSTAGPRAEPGDPRPPATP
jgi:hypothetical protein